MALSDEQLILLLRAGAALEESTPTADVALRVEQALIRFQERHPGSLLRESGSSEDTVTSYGSELETVIPGGPAPGDLQEVVLRPVNPPSFWGDAEARLVLEGGRAAYVRVVVSKPWWFLARALRDPGETPSWPEAFWAAPAETGLTPLFLPEGPAPVEVRWVALKVLDDHRRLLGSLVLEAERVPVPTP
jgi:hypothetical protein